MTEPSAMTPVRTPSARRRDIVVAAACGAFVAVMVGAAYAAVPLYNWFCRTTGFAGTPLVASAAPGHVLDRKITVRFDANVLGGLPWRFEPEQSSVEVRIGDVVTVNYLVVNESAREGTDYDRAELTWLWDVTTIADKTIIERNQAGVDSRFYVPGPLSSMEDFTRRFLDWYVAIMRETWPSPAERSCDEDGFSSNGALPAR